MKDLKLLYGYDLRRLSILLDLLYKLDVNTEKIEVGYNCKSGAVYALFKEDDLTLQIDDNGWIACSFKDREGSLKYLDSIKYIHHITYKELLQQLTP